MFNGGLSNGEAALLVPEETLKWCSSAAAPSGARLWANLQDLNGKAITRFE